MDGLGSRVYNFKLQISDAHGLSVSPRMRMERGEWVVGNPILVGRGEMFTHSPSTHPKECCISGRYGSHARLSRTSSGNENKDMFRALTTRMLWYVNKTWIHRFVLKRINARFKHMTKDKPGIMRCTL